MKRTPKPGEIGKVSSVVIAREYGVTAKTVLNWFHRGLIPGVSIGLRCVRFDADAVRAKLSRTEVSK